jgi:hypothetical protein
MRAAAVLAGLLVLTGAWWAGAPLVFRPARLVVEDVRRGQVVHERPVGPGDRFTLGYLHSVSRTRVSGLFEVGAGGGLIVRETSFGTFGPGLPDLRTGDRYEIRDGAFRQRDLSLPLDALALFVQPETQHVLEVGGDTVELSRTLGAGARIRIRVEPAGVRRAGRPVSP